MRKPKVDYRNADNQLFSPLEYISKINYLSVAGDWGGCLTSEKKEEKKYFSCQNLSKTRTVLSTYKI